MIVEGWQVQNHQAGQDARHPETGFESKDILKV